MALPTSATERLISKPSSLTSQGWLKELLLFGITVLSVSLILWAGLKFGYENYLSSQIQKLDADIQTFNQQISADDRARLVTFYSQLQNVKTLIAAHPLLTPVLSWLEGVTVPQVSYTRVSYSSVLRQLGVSGVAKTANDVTTQLKIFETQPNVAKASFSNLSTNEAGNWMFDFTVSFSAPFTAGAFPATLPTP